VDAIILCGGTGWRLKPDTWVPKPKLKINNNTLISYQINWLKKYGINRIVLATNEADLIQDSSIIYSIEKQKLGTGGAVKKAIEKIKAPKVYVMNVDDIVFYDPKKLSKFANKGASILMAKPQFKFGKIISSKTYIVRFEQKPQLDFYVNTGHYVFDTSIIEQYFPDKGPMETETLQELAEKKKLRGYHYNGLWLTINTMKDLIKVRKHFKNYKEKK
jgi:D-glycero-alpha-D-manno-heptose 1-phosphate guanylyltransferase